jgi:DNA primase large subunit
MNNSSNPYLAYYLRKDVQSKIVKSSKNKEVGVAYADHNFGKRPDILQFDSDVSELAKQGAYSFHISEEIWKNPLQLRSGLTKRELDDLRIGWDLVLDIDCKHLEYSKIAAMLVVEAIKYHDVEHISIKFSGNHGFHIGIPFKAFPDNVHNMETKLLFPDGLRTIANYLKEFIREHLSSRLLVHSLDDLAKNTNQDKEKIIKNNKFDPFTIVDIDTVLISSRHMFRAPYSINEKSGLVSIPILKEDILNFDLAKAKSENVSTNLDFLDDTDVISGEARSLIIQAFDFAAKSKKQEPIDSLVTQQTRVYEDNKDRIPEQFFPGCIKKLLVGNLNDGKKRALFILINFLKCTGYSIEEIKSMIKEWNSKNNPPLKQGYIDSQISWHMRQTTKILPPNCDNANYYSALGVKDSDEFCSHCKNPVNGALRAYRASLANNTKPKRKRKQ